MTDPMKQLNIFSVLCHNIALYQAGRAFVGLTRPGFAGWTQILARHCGACSTVFEFVKRKDFKSLPRERGFEFQ